MSAQKWEFVQRPESKREVDGTLHIPAQVHITLTHFHAHTAGVDTIPIIGDEIQLVLNYRPPVGKFVIELPSGLMDDSDSSASEAALRELCEEAGITASARDVTTVSPLLYCDPWKSNESHG